MSSAPWARMRATRASMSSTANMTRRMPSVFTGASTGPNLIALGVWNLSSSMPCPSGVRIIARVARTSLSPIKLPTAGPSTVVSPSSLRPSSMKNALAASRSSTTMRTLSIRLSVIAFLPCLHYWWPCVPHVENNGIVGHRPHIGANPARVAAYRQTCCVAKYAKVHEAVNEALKLEAALARLRTSADRWLSTSRQERNRQVLEHPCDFEIDAAFQGAGRDVQSRDGIAEGPYVGAGGRTGQLEPRVAPHRRAEGWGRSLRREPGGEPRDARDRHASAVTPR